MHTLHFSGPGSGAEVAVTAVGKFKVHPAAVLGSKVNLVCRPGGRSSFSW